MAVIKLNRTKTGVVPTALEDGELYIDQLNGELYWADATGRVRATSLLGAFEPFEPGTAMLFVQSTAPVGWTKSTAHNDKALRIVSGGAGSGGVTGFLSVFGPNSSVVPTVLTEAQMPYHGHPFHDPGHKHTYSRYSGGVTNGTNFTTNSVTATVAPSLNETEYSGTGCSIGGAGSNQPHTHLIPEIKYVDAIIATRD